MVPFIPQSFYKRTIILQDYERFQEPLQVEEPQIYRVFAQQMPQ
jgi:hypothetical protein